MQSISAAVCNLPFLACWDRIADPVVDLPSTLMKQLWCRARRYIARADAVVPFDMMGEFVSL